MSKLLGSAVGASNMRQSLQIEKHRSLLVSKRTWIVIVSSYLWLLVVMASDFVVGKRAGMAALDVNLWLLGISVASLAWDVVRLIAAIIWQRRVDSHQHRVSFLHGVLVFGGALLSILMWLPVGYVLSQIYNTVRQ